MAAQRASLGLGSLLREPTQQNHREGNWEVAEAGTRSEDSHEPSSEAEPSNDGEEDYEEDSEDMEDILDQPMSPDQYDRLIQPLQTTAERVGREVEEFAEKLERLHPYNEKDKRKRYEKALALADEYYKLAKESVDRLRQKYGQVLEKRVRLEYVGLNRTSKASLSLKDLNVDRDSEQGLIDLMHWTDELKTWDLFRRLTEFQYPRSWMHKEAEIESKLSELDPIDQYSPEAKIWERFLISNETARERQAVLTWLQESAEETGNDVEIITEQLESKGGRHRSMWAHGWLLTKESIKAQKRLRSWPRPLDPSSPGLAATLLNEDRTESIISQLDPDAATRQGHPLTHNDHEFELYLWAVCWEMLRRGKKWPYIREWCKDRVEIWRAVSLRGAEPSRDNTTALNRSFMSNSMLDETDLSRLRDEETPVAKVEGNRSRPLWRRMCFALARNGGLNRYERAVYGLLGGDLDTVEKVCFTWDELLFAHYNSLALYQFDKHLQEHYPDRLTPTMAKRFGLFDAVQFHGDPASVPLRVIENLKQHPVTRGEALQPMKLIQGYLIGKKFSDFLYQYGLALSKMANMDAPSRTIPALDEARDTQYHLEYLRDEDYDGLRVLCHILIIFLQLGLDPGYGDRKIAIENIIVAWIDYLRWAGKVDIVPLYAAYLSPERQVFTLAAVLRDITSTTVRQDLVRLMRAYDIDIATVVRIQIEDALKAAGLEEEPKNALIKVDLLEERNSSKETIPAIKEDFIGDEVSRQDMSLINSFEWYKYVEDQWEDTFRTGASLFKRFFFSKRWAAAQELADRMPSSELSHAKTEALIGEQADLTGDAYDVEEDIQDQIAHIRLSGTELERKSHIGDQPRFTRQVLASQAKLYSEFEKLIWALSELEAWRDTLDTAPTPDESHRTKSWRGQVQNAYENVVRTVEPLLHGWMVDVPADDNSTTTTTTTTLIRTLRTSYLPPIIFAYHSVLYRAGFVLRPELLTRCMNLSTIIAAPDSDVLQCFVDTGTLPDLVRALALSSRAILLVEEKKMVKKNGGAGEAGVGSGVGGPGGGSGSGSGGQGAAGNGLRSSTSRKSRRGGGEVMGVWFVRP
ncbi:MAG: Nucleoporin nup84 [Peltula sp. TS41687]|nr:MAG: Nucleoporin nup84 [Peltula sp. TS41687]